MPRLQAARGASLTDVTPRRCVGILVTVALGVVALDQLTKAWAQATLAGQPARPVLGELLQLTYVRNSGAAFSIGGGLTVVFSLIALVVALVIIRIAPRLGSPAWAIAFGGVLGGAVGNLVDRLFREPAPLRGHVVDWIQIPHWPVFNVADSAIFCSAVLMVVLSLRGVGLDGQRLAAPG